MIVDRILDRKDGTPYNAKELYDYCKDVGEGIGDDIVDALDYKTEEEVKDALCNYIVAQGYNLDICDYIRSVNWIE